MEKIWLVSENGISNTGGVERINYYLYSILSKSGYKVELVDRKKIISEKRMKKIKENHMYFPILCSIFLWKRVKKNEIVISNGRASFFYKNDYLFMHGTSYEIAKLFNGKRINFFTIMEFIACIISKKILAVSESVEEECKQNYKCKENKIKLLENCIDFSKFKPLKIRREKTIVIGFCGSLEERKGIKDLIKFINGADKKLNVEIKIKIVSNTTENFFKFDSHKNVEIKKNLNIKEMNYFYNECDYLLFLSKYEPFGLVILEALGAGTKVIGIKKGVLSSLSNHNFEGIKIIENIEEIFNYINHNLNKTSQKEREEIHDKIKLKYGLKKYKNKLLEVLR